VQNLLGIFLLLFLTPWTYAELNDDILRHACNDPSQYTKSPTMKTNAGEEFQYRYLRMKDSDRIFDCRGVGVNADKLVSTEGTAGECVDCKADKLSIASTAAIVSQAQCPKNNKKEESCNSQVGCVFAADALHLVNAFIPFKNIIAPKCGGNNKGSMGCLGNIVAGVVTGLVDLVKGIGYLASAGWGKLKSWVGGFFADKEVIETDNAMSDVMLAAQEMPKESFFEMVMNTGAWIKNILATMIGGMMDSAKSAATCEEWKGAPLVSECSKPSVGWDCMDCAQKTETVCALTGVVGSDLVLMFVAGASFAKVAAKLAKSSEALDKVKNVVDVAKQNKFGKVAIATTVAVAGGAKYVGGKALAVLAQLDKLPVLKQWAHVNEKAFLEGLKVGGSGLAVQRPLLTGAHAGNASESTSIPLEQELIRTGVSPAAAKRVSGDESQTLNFCPVGR